VRNCGLTNRVLHYTYLWPLCTAELQRLAGRSKRAVLVEQNYQGQLGMLIRMECGLDITDKILKYDGRPFFYDELLSLLLARFGRTEVASLSSAKRIPVVPQPSVPDYERSS